MSPSTDHQQQTENTLKCKQSLNYYTYYFLSIVNIEERNAMYNSICVEQIEYK